MRMQHSYIRELKRALESAHLGTYKQRLVIKDADLADACMRMKFKDLKSGIAHFKRVIGYFKSTYAYVPTFKHYISERVPVVADIADWEKALYEKYPDFTPEYTSPSDSFLRGKPMGYSHLFGSREIIKFVADFAYVVAQTQFVTCFTQAAPTVLERLIYSMVYHKWHREFDYDNALEALQVIKRSKHYVDKIEGAHWSRILVDTDIVSIYGNEYKFWEMAKLIVNPDFAAHVTGMPKFSEPHARGVLDAMATYGLKNKCALDFLVDIRSEYALDSHEKKEWAAISPNFFPSYPL